MDSFVLIFFFLFASRFFQMLHPKTIHFPSGYPISRSPPVFVCASPGPDPYRSLDNVYEELGPRDSDIESEPRVQSDDDFAEDELSLNGGAAQPYHISSTVQDGVLATANNTSIPMATSTSTCAAISQTIPSISSLYNECMNSGATGNHNSDNNNGDNSHTNGNPNEMERNSNDRHSLLSSSSSSASTAPVNDGAAGNSNSSFSSGPTRIASPDSGLALRNRTKRLRNGGKMTPSPNELPTNRNNAHENGSHDDTSSESNHLMTQHPYFNHQSQNYNQYRSNNNVELSHSNSNNSSISNQMNSVNNNVNSRNGSGAISTNGAQINGTNTDVERHNQINKQLSASEHPMIPKFGGNRSAVPTNYQSQMAQEQMISTIFPGRLINSNSNLNNYNRHQMQNQYYSPSDNIRCSANSNSRSRTNPRSSRHRATGNTLPYSYQNDNTYSYAEPVFHEDMASACAPPLHGGYRTISTSNRRPYHANHHSSPYMPNYQNFNERDARHARNRNHIGIPSTSTEMGHIQPIYSHDSSFGSDSGYSQYTHNSRSKSDGSNSAHSASSTNGNHATATLSNMFSWARRKEQQQQSNRNKTGNAKSIPPMRSS